MSQADQDKNTKPESVEADDELESLSPEEKAAFEKIMAEIGAVNGSDAQDESTDKVESVVEEEAPPQSTDAALSQNEGNAVSDKAPVPESGESELSEDQNSQLAQIMAEIEGKGGSAEEGDGNSTATADTEEMSDDQQAALDKIMAEIGTKRKNDLPASDADESESPDDAEAMSDDQQAALDKIMTEIEAKRKNELPDSDADESKSPDDAEAMSDDQQAALDKIMAEIEAKRKNDLPDSDADESESPDDAEAVSDDQQAALDKIMAEIEAKKAKDTGADDETDPSQAVDAASDEEEEAGMPANLSMDEFDDELSQLLSTAAAAPVQKATRTKADTRVADEQVQAPTPADKGRSRSQNLKDTLEKVAGPSAPPPSLPEAVDDAYPLLQEVPLDDATAGQGAMKQKRAPARRNSIGTGWHRKRLWQAVSAVTASVLLTAIGFWGYQTFFQAPTALPLTPAPLSATAPPPAVAEARPNPTPPDTTPTIPAPAATVATAPSSWRESTLRRPAEASFAQLQTDLSAARNDIQNKISDIQQLKSYYTLGIAQDIEAIENNLSNDRIPKLDQAMANTKIELALRAIQRRDVYITKLDTPLTQLMAMSEELLYMERRAKVYEVLHMGIHGLPLDAFRQEVTTAIGSFLQFNTEISIDSVDVPPKPLSAIWQEVSAEISKKVDRIAQRTPLNRAISAEICRGNYDRMFLLTAMAPETASCLIKWSGKDLFLNEMTELDPEVARILTQWPGEWLSLNSVKELSAEAAQHLSQWPGERLSLNGLTVLSAEATTQLSQWQGTQLEMVGLASIGRWQNYGTQLFLSEQLRRQLEAN
ncbi:MAG: hypothetical protein KFF50_03210 [Desulfatitalea sp.]|nr:hypothetical protein [Desulfatitalea sp.]